MRVPFARRSELEICYFFSAPDLIEVDEDEVASGKVNLANAVDLSESEEEEDLENIMDDFALPTADMDTVRCYYHHTQVAV